MPNKPNGKEVNFMQVGETFECNSCHPEVGYDICNTFAKCECKCHKEQPKKEEIMYDKTGLMFISMRQHEQSLKSQREQFIDNIRRVDMGDGFITISTVLEILND